MTREGQGRRVVIVDNDRTVLELLQIRLDLAGYHPLVERTAPAALETIRKMRPAAAIVELDLPAMDGFDLLKALDPRGEGLPCPVLVMARKLGPDDIREAVRLGAKDCMTKPFSGADMLERVSRLFRRPPPSPGTTRAPALV